MIVLNLVRGKLLQFSALPMLVASLFLAACTLPTPPATAEPATRPVATTVPDSAVDTADALANSTWQLTSLGAPAAPVPVVVGSTVTLDFGTAGQVGGNSGCNGFGGRYQVEEGSLVFSEIASTLRACAEQPINEQETQFLQALQQAGRFERSADTLRIWYDNEAHVLTFAPASAVAQSPGVPTNQPSTDTPTETSTQPAETPAASAEPAETIEFVPGETSTLRSGTLPTGGVKEYALHASAGQTMHLQTIGDSAPVNFTMRSPGGTTWTGEFQPSGVYIFTKLLVLPETGTYVVTLSVPTDASATRYDVAFTIYTDTAPTPDAAPERITFAPNTTSTQLSAMLPSGVSMQQYVLTANAEQTLEIHVTSADVPVSFTTRSPYGTEWSAESLGSGLYVFAKTLTLPETGDYVITLVKPAHSPSASYEMSVTIR